jgi:phosphopantothenoylcysteine decarboxylase/phosphopantothenate--cysteine ligase
MGIALADAAAEYGAEVDLVLGPVNPKPSHQSIIVTNVTTARSMADECFARFPSCDVAILSAAVADFTPEVVNDRKIKKKGDDLVLRLKPTTDIAAQLGVDKKESQLLVGFALETDNGIEYAKQKLNSKNLDMIVLNTLGEEGAGFGFNTNRITIIDRNNNIDKFELKSKEEAARDILDKIVLMLRDL